MQDLVRPTRKRIDEIKFNAKDPLWGTVNYFESQLSELFITKNTKGYRGNIGQQININIQMNRLSEMRDLHILSSYN